MTKNVGDFGVHNSGKERNIIRIPAFVLLYLLGHAEKNDYKEI